MCNIMEIGREHYNFLNSQEHTLKSTLKEVERLSLTYCSDLIDFKNYSLLQFFDYVAKDIQYEPDPENQERVCRPAVTMSAGFGDCDDKTVLCLSFFVLKKITCGYSIVSQRPDKKLHHIFPFIVVKKRIYDFDATYNYNNPYEVKNWTFRQDKILYRGLT